MYTSDYGYSSYNTYGSDMAGMVGWTLIFVFIIAIAALVLAILGVIGQWKAFKKAGKRGWECLIAGHNQFVNLEFVGLNPIWVLIIMLSSVVTIVPILGFLAWLAIIVYYLYLVGVSTARSFGKSTGFGIGLAIPITAPIFWFILGGKDVQYVGPHPVNDFVMGWFKKNSVNQPNTNMGNEGFKEVQSVVNPVPPVAPVQPVEPQVAPPVQPTVRFCTSCGYKMANGESFCPGCGKAIQ